VQLMPALAVLLIAHGLVHVSLNTVPYGVDTPFWPSWWRPEPGRSWLLQGLGAGDDLTRILGGALLVLSTVGFVAAGLSLAGWVLPQTWWPSLTFAAAASSLLLFALFPHAWLVVGIVLSAGSLWAAWVRWPLDLRM
jgi:hypothetical protein